MQKTKEVYISYRIDISLPISGAGDIGQILKDFNNLEKAEPKSCKITSLC